MIASLVFLFGNIIYIILRLFHLLNLHTTSVTLDCIYIGLCIIAIFFVYVVFSIKYTIKNDKILMLTSINTLMNINISDICKLIVSDNKMLLDALNNDIPTVININIDKIYFDSFITNIKQINPKLFVEIIKDN